MKADDGSLKFDGSNIYNQEESITLDRLAQELVVGDGHCSMVNASHSSPISPPPFMAGFVEIELDLETGKVDIIDYVGVVDCGTLINPNLVRIQKIVGFRRSVFLYSCSEKTIYIAFQISSKTSS